MGSRRAAALNVCFLPPFLARYPPRQPVRQPLRLTPPRIPGDRRSRTGRTLAALRVAAKPPVEAAGQVGGVGREVIHATFFQDVRDGRAGRSHRQDGAPGAEILEQLGEHDVFGGIVPAEQEERARRGLPCEALRVRDGGVEVDAAGDAVASDELGEGSAAGAEEVESQAETIEVEIGALL